MPKITKFSELFGLITWGSLIVESWLLLIRQLPLDNISIFFFVFFLILGITASSYGANKTVATAAGKTTPKRYDGSKGKPGDGDAS